MKDNIVEQVAFTNLPNNICSLTQQPTSDPVVMHRDLSDWLPANLQDIRNDRLDNLLIVDRHARQRYYEKLKQHTVILSFSGGLDSTTVLHWCIKLFGHVHCMMFDYGQRHRVELENASAYLDSLNGSDKDCKVTSELINMNVINELAATSSLINLEFDVPVDRDQERMTEDIPNTFVPGRNIYFITALAQRAYQYGARHIALGVNVLDYSGYPDCRPEFLEAIQNSLRIGIFNGSDFALHAPLLYHSKKDIIRIGLELGVQYDKTHSCYEGVSGGCGRCDSCQLRRAAFADLGMVDPAIKE